MSELLKPQKIIVMRNGIEIWIDEEKFNQKEEALKTERFIKIGENIINTADIMAVVSPNVLEETTRRKNGQWKCKHGTWHERGEQCACEEFKKYQKF
jgi:hypothetical protein